MIFSNYEKTKYLEFVSKYIKYENINFCFYYLLYVFPSIYYLINIIKLDILSFLYLFVICFCFEQFYFIIGHLYVHQYMLVSYQNNLIKEQFAYYHHYVNSLLYSKIPFGYRVSPNIIFMLFNVFSILFGINELFYGIILIIGTIDYLAHEYHHSYRKKHYISFNPFSSKFIGIYYLMNVLEKIGIIDIKSHATIHHKEKSSSMHLTEDWLDLKIIFVSNFVDICAKIEWYIFKKIINIINGSYKAEYICETNLKYDIERIMIDLWALFKIILLTYCLSLCNFQIIEIFNIRYYLIFITIIHMILEKIIS